MIHLHRRTLTMGAAAAVLLASTTSWAQSSYPAPDMPVHVIVPYVAGGPSDFVARLVARKLSERMKHTFLVENRPGGNTIIGADYVAKSKPDGYTLYVVGDLTHASLNALNNKLPFNPTKDFAGISNLVESPLVISVPSQFPASTLKEFVQYAKAHPGEVNYGSAGMGNTLHLAAENFSKQAKIEMNHVQYKGGSQALLDLLAGRIQVTFDLPQTPLQHIQSGKLKALAVTSGKRLAILPQVPTTIEAGFPDYRFVTRIGLLATGGTPQPILEKLHSEIVKITEDPEFRTAIAGQAMFAAPSESPAAYQKLMQDSMTTVGELLRGANVTPQ